MIDIKSSSTSKIGILGLGYVGLPLAVEFGKKRDVVGFDISSDRVDELKSGVDYTLEVTSDELASATGLSFSDDINSLADCEVYIVAVPTPVDDPNRPDISNLISAFKASWQGFIICQHSYL